MKRFLKPVTGIYEKTAKPYKKLFQEVKMTFDIEIEARKYRLVGFYPWFKNGLGPFSVKRYIVVDQEGKVIKDEEIVLLCTQAYLLMTSMIDSENLILMDYSGQDKIAAELEQLMREITEQVTPHIKGKTHFYKMVDFYSKSKQSEISMDHLSKKLAPLYKSVLEKQSLTFDELEQIAQIYVEFTNTSRQRVILVLDTAIDRGVVKGLITSRDYSKYVLPEQKKQLPKLFGTFDGADQAERHALMNNNKHGRRKYEDIIKDLQAEPYDWLTERINEYFTKRWSQGATCPNPYAPKRRG